MQNKKEGWFSHPWGWLTTLKSKLEGGRGRGVVWPLLEASFGVVGHLLKPPFGVVRPSSNASFAYGRPPLKGNFGGDQINTLFYLFIIFYICLFLIFFIRRQNCHSIGALLEKWMKFVWKDQFDIGVPRGSLRPRLVRRDGPKNEIAIPLIFLSNDAQPNNRRPPLVFNRPPWYESFVLKIFCLDKK